MTVPDEAVEAAANIIRERDYPDYMPDLDFARRVLRVAAPLIAAQAWDAAVASLEYPDGSKVEVAANHNPYRSGT